MTKIRGPILIGDNFHPECFDRNNCTKEQNKKMLEAWRNSYHKNVDEVFEYIKEGYFNENKR